MPMTTRLPDTVQIDGADYPIHTDFRTSIDFELLFFEDLNGLDILMRGLELYYDENIPQNQIAAVEAMMWFYRGGEEEKKKASSAGKIPYSFSCDTDYIFSAFLDQYRIDLWAVEYLHWWKFRAMFKSLTDDKKISEIMMYRTMRIDSKMSREQKAFYRKMQKLYAIPCSKKQQEKKNALEEALLNGGDIGAILGGEM